MSEPQSEKRKCFSTHFKAILKQHCLEEHIKEYFCFIKKYLFSTHSENIQNGFSKGSRLVTQSWNVDASGVTVCLSFYLAEKGVVRQSDD